MQKNSYKEFSQIYDLLMNDIDYEKWTSFIINKIGKNKNKILEAACGTGGITCILSEKNYKITAFDLSEDMLMRAYDKLGRNKSVKLLNQNMTDFEIDDKFDSAICCCDGVNYLKENEVYLFFKRIFKHLNTGSSFIFDISTEYKYNTMYDDNYVYDDGEIFYVWENMLDDENNSVNMEINFFINDSKDKYNRITEIQTQYIYPAEKIKNILSNVGFSNIEIYDDYNDIFYNDESLRAVFCCTKV
nr:class I SAM-dependent methyltransferase [Sedimentibacter sp.]